ncbi:MAG: RagB/SusD family nutrient uptake outer membrane protein [Prevotella sp.]|nr:RagB/SusD family nutrient uptake outer membrane protein [Prevotella sp.]
MNKYIGISLIAVSAALVSCNDFLDELPDNRAELNSEANIELLLTSAYPQSDFIAITEYSSDNVDDYGENNPYTQRFLDQVYHWEDVTETNNEDPENVWQASYNAIASANQALEAIEQLDEPLSANMLQAKGEALLCRAFNHFLLVNIFANHYDAGDSKSLGVPYVTKPETTLKPDYTRATVKENYEMIEKDLQEGLQLVGESYYKVPKYHFNKKAAYAFANRFYLYYGDYQKAIDYANLVLGTNPNVMLRDWDYQSTMTQEFDAISQHYIDASLNCNLLLNTAYSSIGLAFGPYDVWKRYSHGAFIGENEDGYATNIWGAPTQIYCQIKRYGATNLDAYVFWRLPYLFEYTDHVAGIGYRRTVYPMLTADEVLLNRAEAYALLKDYNSAANDLNAWMHNFTMSTMVLTPENIQKFYSGINYCYDAVDSKGNVTGEDGRVSTQKKHLHPKFSIDAENSVQECILQCVLGFRRLETLHSGMRWFDIKRYGIEIPRRLMNSDGNPVQITDWLRVDDPRRAIQIPQKVVNAGLTPNPRVTTDDNSMIRPIEDKYLLTD